MGVRTPHRARRSRSTSAGTCTHTPCCPSADSGEACLARVRTAHPEQGWCLLCNGVIAFDDGGAVFPDSHTIEPPASAAAA
ncbi:DUF5999 family protein [Streptomyces sp. NBC_00258]